MTTTHMRRKAIVLTLATVFAGAPLAARAQHVVTEDEASKLTLEALTAAPRPVYRPVYRASYRPASWRFEHRSHGWQRAVYRASYRTAETRHVSRHHRR